MSIYSIGIGETINPDKFNIKIDDPILNGKKAGSLQNEIALSCDDMNRLFLEKYNLGYISKFFGKRILNYRIVTHPEKTNTCYQKAMNLGDWNLLNAIKALYFTTDDDQLLYSSVVPETGCFLDRSHLKDILGFGASVEMHKSNELPQNMSFGTCSPFVNGADFIRNGGKVKKIIFDSETLINKKRDNTLDDFSLGLDHRFSIQMNY